MHRLNKLLYLGMRQTTFIILLINLLYFNEVYSQSIEKKQSNQIWAEAGFGIFTHRATPAFGKTFWANYSRGNNIYKLRYQDFEEFRIMGPSPREYTKSLSLMIGKKRGNDIVHLSASGGLGISTGVSRGNFLYTDGTLITKDVFETKTFSKISLPLEIDFVFKPFPYFGMGLALTGDINSERSNMGILLKAGFGLYK